MWLGAILRADRRWLSCAGAPGNAAIITASDSFLAGVDEAFAGMVPGKVRTFDHVAIAIIRACAMNGVVDKTGDLYRRMSSLLSFERDFFSVWIAGACLKLQSISGTMDLDEMTEEQYRCMRMLDQFAYLPGIPWG
jgi:hypothetical protein